MNDLLVTMTDDTQYICHYGVMGMKWGKRNAETLRKYKSGNGGQVSKKKGSSGESRVGKVAKAAGRSIKTAGMTAGSKAATAAKAAVRNALDQHAKRKQVDKLMDDAGVKKKKQREAFEKARAQTLSSHDPETVFKGAYTLTDEELGLKINRLKKEGELLDMASNRKQAAARANAEAQNALRAKRQADQASLKGRIQTAAIDAVKTVVVDTGKDAAKRVLDKHLPKPEKDKKKKNQAESSDKNSDDSSKSKKTVSQPTAKIEYVHDVSMPSVGKSERETIREQATKARGEYEYKESRTPSINTLQPTSITKTTGQFAPNDRYEYKKIKSRGKKSK